MGESSMKLNIRRWKEIVTGTGTAIAYGPVHRVAEREKVTEEVPLESDEMAELEDHPWVDSYLTIMDRDPSWGRGRLRLPLDPRDTFPPFS